MDNINTHVAMMNSSTTSSIEYVFGFVVNDVVVVVVFQLYALGIVRFRSFVVFVISVDIGSETGM